MRIMNHSASKHLVWVALALFALACSKDAQEASEPKATDTSESETAQPAPATAKAVETAQPASASGDNTKSTLTDGQMNAIFETPIKTLDGEASSLASLKGNALLVVNVASKCGLTPQYTDLEKLHKEYKDRGFAVVGMPCNQFGGQEPGTAKEIKEFCSLTYGVTFPMFEKIEVNGANRHPIYQSLTTVADAKGEAGDVQWNFEKFLISADGKTITRFRPRTTPYDPTIIAAIEAGLPKK